MMRSARPEILSISFSPLRADARVLRQVRALQEVGSVTTCGFGPAPEGVEHHVSLAEGLPSLPRTPAGVALLAARRFEAAETNAPALRAALKSLAIPPGGRPVDLVVANDARALPVAHMVARGAPVWADMHEWALEEFAQDWRWRTLVRPFAEHLCGKYLPASAVVTTVCEPIAALYRDTFGVACAVVRNAPAFEDLRPTPMQPGRIRLVHSGSAVAGRGLDTLVRVARELDERFSLDLYLTRAGDGGRHLRHLRSLAAGCARITFHDPVPPAQLSGTLNRYDVGVYSLPPANINAQLALPNKFFDFVQARLALAVGPSQEMARTVREHGLGVVAEDFTAEALRSALQSLTTEAVAAGKAAAHRAAAELSSTRDRETIIGLARQALGTHGAVPPSERGRS